MIKFHQATVSYGPSIYKMTSRFFPKTLQDPAAQTSLIEAEVRRQHPTWNFRLQHHCTPAFPEFNVPSFHVFMCDGVRVSYVSE